MTAYARRLGARAVAVAPQAVDNAFWATPVAAARASGRSRPCSWGATYPRRGWRCSARPGSGARLGDARLEVVEGASPEQVRNSYAAADVLVIPSIATRHFLEPWGLVANEAMNQRLPIIATDAVGAAAGGLVRDGRNGLVVAAGDPDALARRPAHACRPIPALRARLGAQGAQDVAAYTHAAWADAFANALRGATERSGPLVACSTQPGRGLAAAPARCHRAMRRLLTTSRADPVPRRARRRERRQRDQQAPS